MEYVKSIDGLYDEQDDKIIMHINNRSFCWTHKWVNAELEWRKRLGERREVCIGWESHKPFVKFSFHRYLIRFCRRCKRIDCIHSFDAGQEYRIGTEMCYLGYHIVTCQFCGKRILLNSWSVIKGQNEKGEPIKQCFVSC